MLEAMVVVLLCGLLWLSVYGGLNVFSARQKLNRAAKRRAGNLTFRDDPLTRAEWVAHDLVMPLLLLMQAPAGSMLLFGPRGF